ncbi:MAG: toll/interleukin-1 receptor domain-containing protein [Lachnospiraceae bacterium]|nr:toll/interleukin-1 receptor domain-containing protein [Lachnospiraceae bacterium]
MNKDIKDFFISYNKADKEIAKWIAGTLEENDYTTYIQAWDFRPGNNFILQMQDAIKKCKRTIIVLSQNYLNSEYCQAEWAASYNYDPTGKDRKLIPVRVDNVSLDGLLSSIIYIDLYGCDEEVAKKKLLNGIDENENPRRKPNFLSYAGSVNDIQHVEFLFEISEDVAEDLSISTNNYLLKWYCDMDAFDYDIKIIDKRIIELDNKLAEINVKIDNKEKLTTEEMYKYDLFMRESKQRKTMIQMKSMAVDLFLKDKVIHGYLHIFDHITLWNHIRSILNNNYFNKPDDFNKYILLDIFLKPEPKEFRSYFVSFVEREKIIKKFGECTSEALYGFDVCDLDNDSFEVVVSDFYLFIADEVIRFNHDKIMESKKALNLLNYYIGIH